jgi:hypothetical protein
MSLTRKTPEHLKSAKNLRGVAEAVAAEVAEAAVASEAVAAEVVEAAEVAEALWLRRLQLWVRRLRLWLPGSRLRRLWLGRRGRQFADDTLERLVAISWRDARHLVAHDTQSSPFVLIANFQIF